MKECDIEGGVKTYSDPSYIFSGGQDPQPNDLRPCSQVHLKLVEEQHFLHI